MSLYRVELRTAAQILCAEHMADGPAMISALNAYWSAISNDALFLAWENADGVWSLTPSDGAAETDRGVFCRHSYRNDDFVMGFDSVTEPLVLTEPGSVFVLASKEPARASKELTRLRHTGLPVLAWKGNTPDADVRLDFAETPFVPENGYGAIKVEEGVQ